MSNFLKITQGILSYLCCSFLTLHMSDVFKVSLLSLPLSHKIPKKFKLLKVVCYHLSFLTLIWCVATCNSRNIFKELSPHSSFCALSCALLMWRFTFSLNDHIGFPISQALLTLSKHTQYHRRESLFTSRVNYYPVRYNLLYLFIKTETWCVKL